MIRVRYNVFQDDKLVVQIALQATMVGHIKWFCYTWDYQLPEIPSQLEHIYASIRMKGTYTVHYHEIDETHRYDIVDVS